MKSFEEWGCSICFLASVGFTPEEIRETLRENAKKVGGN